MILLVEDDDEIREGLEELLTSEGYRVTSAPNGRAGLDQLRKPGDWDLVLLDLMMPVMDGWAFRREQLKDAALARVPVVLMTGASDSKDAGSALGVTAVVAKPFDLGLLLGTVSRHARPG